MNNIENIHLQWRIEDLKRQLEERTIELDMMIENYEEAVIEIQSLMVEKYE